MIISVPALRKYVAFVRLRRVYSVILLVLCVNACCWWPTTAIAGPTNQQEQELMLLDALSKRQPSYYGTSNSIMDILGRSRCSFSSLFIDRIAVTREIGLTEERKT